MRVVFKVVRLEGCGEVNPPLSGSNMVVAFFFSFYYFQFQPCGIWILPATPGLVMNNLDEGNFESSIKLLAI